MNIAAILPELILTAGATVLMMVAAFMGRRASVGSTRSSLTATAFRPA